MAPGHAVKRRRLSPSGEATTNGEPADVTAVKGFYAHASKWDLEQDYEQRPRKSKTKEKEKTRLPIKTAEGALEHVDEPELTESESNNALESDDDAAPPVAAKPAPGPPVPAKVQIVQAKEELARIAMLINESPEEHMELFKRLAEMAQSAPLATVKKLALGTQAAIYKDVIPGYRIRPLTDEDPSVKISKEVRTLRNFEQSLLSGYRSYVQLLDSYTKTSGRGAANDDEGLKAVAVACACNLLTAVPHFNFRGELLKILVGQLSRRRASAEFIKCRETLKEIFSKDDDGIVSMEAVALLAKMLKTKHFNFHPSVLDTFLHLRLLAEFSSKGSKDGVDKEKEDEPDTYKGKKLKAKREFRTKKERKLLKERKVVAKDMEEADALVRHEQRDKNQAETLKFVFTTYFRVLKTRKQTLIGPALEGIAKYSHLINQDFFGDLLEVLRELISDADQANDAENSDDEEDGDLDNTTENGAARNATRDALLCSTTAFALLDGQDASKAASTLHLDLGFFITHLYQTLYPVSLNPDIEYSPTKSLHLPDPGTAHESSSLHEPQKDRKVNFQTPTVLLLRCLQAILTAKGSSAAPPLRLAGFAKRLMTVSLQLPEKSALALLSLLARIAKLHGRKIATLWNTEERRGDGVFHPAADDIEGSNVFAGTVWEGELLKLHYCPEVRDAAKAVDKAIAGVK